jgi:hypothetical protein
MNLNPRNPQMALASIALAISGLLAACGGGGSADPAPVVAEPLPLPGPVPVVPSPDPGGRPAVVVLGQADFESAAPDRGGLVSAKTLESPRGIAVTDEGALFVADTKNNRLLRFDPVPSVSGQAADLVLGQEGFEGSSPSVSRKGMHLPYGVAVGAGRMAVADFASSRVLVYNEIPADGSAEPAVAIGQADFESAVHECAERGLSHPGGVAITPRGKLIVADTLNNRVLIWDPMPSTHPAPPPTLVIGQRDTAHPHCAPNDDNQDGLPDEEEGTGRWIASRSTLSAPVDVWSNDKYLVVADAANHRVLIWNDFPLTPFQPADVVLGHLTFTNTAPNSESDADATPVHPTRRTFVNPQGVHSDGTALAVADSLNHRVLIWNSFPTVNGQEADAILGHSDFERIADNDRDNDGFPDAATARVLHTPSRVLLTDKSVIVSDREHNRILVFPKVPTTDE